MRRHAAPERQQPTQKRELAVRPALDFDKVLSACHRTAQDNQEDLGQRIAHHPWATSCPGPWVVRRWAAWDGKGWAASQAWGAGSVACCRSSNRQGLGHVAQSWAGNGDNHPVSPQQLPDGTSRHSPTTSGPCQPGGRSASITCRRAAVAGRPSVPRSHWGPGDPQPRAATWPDAV